MQPTIDIFALFKIAIMAVTAIILISFILYKVYGHNLVLKMWIRIFPTVSLAILITAGATEMKVSKSTMALLMIGGAVSLLLLSTFVLTGRYFEKNIGKSVVKVRNATNEVTQVSGQIATTGLELAQNAAEQATSIEETSSSLQEITSMVHQNSENTKQAAAIMELTNDSAKRGIDAMKQMEASMNDIQQSSAQTAKIIKTINEIAFQTNLLALNAAIEAARAGEAGMGFAVVAEEVRDLAQKSAAAVKNTADLIASQQKSVNEGVDITNKVSSILMEINTNVNKVVTVISEVSTASQEQSRGIDEVSKAVSEMEKTIHNVSVNAEKSALSVEGLSAQTKELHGMVAELSRFVGLKDVLINNGVSTPNPGPPGLLRNRLDS
jgi:methyl-accepting chemotaxis protein